MEMKTVVAPEIEQALVVAAASDPEGGAPRAVRRGCA